MGTRHLTIIKLGDKVHGQYGQWDGYPEGQGETVRNFMATVFNEDLFRKQFEATKFLTDDEVHARWNNAGADGSGWVNMDVAARFKESNYQLSRDCGADVLEYVQNAKTPEVHNRIGFAADSLFCEWGWMIDLDARTVRVFRGFNRQALADGQYFKYLESESEGEYHPIREIASIPFDDFRGLTKGDFLAKIPVERDE